ncbi:MAG: extracellular solute-binding protein [Clostridia bacterium]|nr:extracellular solute-binding protein [Clostridia bacterium]
MTTKSSWLKSILCTLVVAIMALAPMATGAASAPVTIRFWIEQTQDEAMKQMGEWFEQFNKSQKEVRVELRNVGSGDEYLQAVRAALASGSDIDLFRLFGPSTMPPFADAGLLLDLTPYSTKYNWKDKLFAYALESHTYKGKLFAFPGNPETLLLYYNKTQFDKRGWKVPTNWDELCKTCENIQKANYIPIAFGTRGFTPANEWWLSVVFNSAAGPENVYKALTGQIPWTSAPFVDSINKLKFMWDKGWIMNKQMYDVSNDDAIAIWGAQKALMMMDGSWGVKYAPTYARDFEWALVPFPSMGAPKATLPLALGFTVGVSSRTKHPDAVAQFLNWLTENPKSAVEYGIKSNLEFWLPLKKGTPDLLPATTAPKTGDMYRAIYEAESTGRFGYATWTFWSPETQLYMYENLPRVLLDMMSTEDYLKEAQSIFAKELAKGKVPPVPKPAK